MLLTSIAHEMMIPLYSRHTGNIECLQIQYNTLDGRVLFSFIIIISAAILEEKMKMEQFSTVHTQTQEANNGQTPAEWFGNIQLVSMRDSLEHYIRQMY